VRIPDIIRKKRDGGRLTEEEITYFVSGVTDGSIPDYQASALLMAACIRGMTDEETTALTKAMLRSGSTLDTRDIPGMKIDKHSTGGVGDKTSIILAPLMAAMGTRVPMISGRGLGHTGGTLDKLEAIPGFRTDLSPEESLGQLGTVGCFVAGQSQSLVPADRRLYAVRDVTATVDSIPLIAASIMSKKLAEGLDGLVLDVKTGAGAFMRQPEDARTLARLMVKIGMSFGVTTIAVITDMEQPLGKTVGNALELKECVTALRGKGAPDLMEVTLTLAAWMLNVADAVSEGLPPRGMNDFTMRSYRHEAMEFIDKGDAFRKFLELVDAQDGEAEAVLKPADLPSARETHQVVAERGGHIRSLDGEAVGKASMRLGAGRARAGDTVDPAAGIILNKKVGDIVEQGEPVAMFHCNDSQALPDAVEVFLSGLEIGGREKAPRPLVHEVILEEPGS
jgi:pyrimidine-nucleoside phosphorylase